MLINGRVRQACSALVDRLLDDKPDEIELRPMSKFPVVRDLCVDRGRLFRALQKVKAWIPVDGYYDLGPGPRQSQAEQEQAYPLSECMSCGCCLEACPQYLKIELERRRGRNRRGSSRRARTRRYDRGVRRRPRRSARRCSSTRHPTGAHERRRAARRPDGRRRHPGLRQRPELRGRLPEAHPADHLDRPRRPRHDGPAIKKWFDGDGGAEGVARGVARALAWSSRSIISFPAPPAVMAPQPPEKLSATSQVSWGVRIALAILIALHLAAVMRLTPPTMLVRLEPILAADYPLHAYHVDFIAVPSPARSCLGAMILASPRAKLCCRRRTPAAGFSSGGCAAAVRAPEAILRTVLFATALTFPLWIWLAMRLLGFPVEVRLCSLAVLLAIVWLYPTMNGFLFVGMVDFALLCFLAPSRWPCSAYLAAPSPGRHAAFALAFSAVLLVHVLGIVVLAPPLVALTLAVPLTWRQRLGAMASPVWAAPTQRVFG